MTEKERILKIVEQMPDTATAEDVMNELYFKEIVDRGLSDLAAGRLISHDEAKQRLAQWLEK
jgi:predicted transcriptional regulator